MPAKPHTIYILVCLLLTTACINICYAQQRPPRTPRMDGQGRPMGPAGGAKLDSLEQRNNDEDSITIYYRMFDSSRVLRLDSSVNDFYRRFPIPSHYVNLGTLGQPGHSLLFQPYYQPGWDAGFHAFDVHRFTVNNTKLYQTTRPYTELDYILGSNLEQTIRVLHTQNITPNWNAALDMQVATSPGNLKNQNTSNGNLRFNTHFVSKEKRYSGVFIIFSNRNRASQNGGIANDSFLVSTNQLFEERSVIPVVLGPDRKTNPNPFSAEVETGLDYRQQVLMYRHQFDFGQKDSSINLKDSSVIRYFYPRFRIQHQLKLSNQYYHYLDLNITDSTSLAVYKNKYNLDPKYVPDSLRDQWREITNEGALILFPQKDNQDQFLKAGAGLQLLYGRFDTVTKRNYSNLYLLGEYRNRTRNRRWDILANGQLYLSGLNAGDYKASVSLETQLGKRAGTLQLGFENINRTPSYVFDSTSSFFTFGDNNLKQENWTHFSGRYALPQLQVLLSGNYYLVANYTYMKSFTEFEQDATVQSVLHLSAEKKFRLSKRWNLYSEVHVQQTAGGAINLPLVYTRNRLAFEGVFYKNLNLSTGLEARYHTPYTADNFSPFNGLWVRQTQERINNRPDVAAYLHFRIKSLSAFLRAENLNTFRINPTAGFLKNNIVAPLYPSPGLFMHIGIHWRFVN